jgi:hypothetical protein
MINKANSTQLNWVGTELGNKYHKNILWDQDDHVNVHAALCMAVDPGPWRGPGIEPALSIYAHPSNLALYLSYIVMLREDYCAS